MPGISENVKANTFIMLKLHKQDLLWTLLDGHLGAKSLQPLCIDTYLYWLLSLCYIHAWPNLYTKINLYYIIEPVLHSYLPFAELLLLLISKDLKGYHANVVGWVTAAT